MFCEISKFSFPSDSSTELYNLGEFGSSSQPALIDSDLRSALGYSVSKVRNFIQFPPGYVSPTLQLFVYEKTSNLTVLCMPTTLLFLKLWLIYETTVSNNPGELKHGICDENLKSPRASSALD